MLQINTNVNSRIHYDEWGSQFVTGMPRMFFRSRDTVRWQLYSETPGLDEDETPVSDWTKYTGFAGVTGINAYLTADNNYTHRMKGTLEEAVSTTPSLITANISGAGFDLIPEYGTLNLFDNEGHFESLQYNGREIDGSTVVFQVDGSVTLGRAYDAGWVMDAGEEVYMQATLDYQESDVSNGLFVFDITAYSEKLRQTIVYSDVESVPIRGLELAIFQVRDGGKQDLERYVVTTFKIMSGIAETGIDPVLPEEHQNEAVLMLETLLASGFSIQYSNDGETWTDTQPEDVSDEESSSSSSSASLSRYVYFRFRSASVGGTWSSPIRLRNGKDGEAGIRGNRITTGTAITGRSETPSAYPTGIEMAYVNDLYINTVTQDVYVCTYEGDEETALWMYSFCLKGEAFDAIDDLTITLNSDSELQAVAVREMNKSNIQQIWVGTLEEYTEQGVANTDILAFITDDSEASGIDSQLSDSSTNPVQNWVIKQAVDKKQDIARQIVSSSSASLTVEPNKSYVWNLSSNGVLSFDGTGLSSKYVEIPVYLNLTGTPVITGVDVEGTPRTGYWKLVWNGSSAVFREEGSGSSGDIDSELSDSSSNAVQNKVITNALSLKADKSEIPTIDSELSDSSENPVQNKVITNALSLKADKSEIPTIDSELSDSSENPVQNKAVATRFGLTDDAIAEKQDILRTVVSSTSTSLAVESNKAYVWTPSGNATISFDHTGLSGKNTSIPIKLTISNGKSVSGSTSSSTAVTVEGTVESGFWELIWDGSTATFRKGNGNDGTSIYTYVAYASDNSGSNFSNTPSDSLQYRAEIHVNSLISTPSASDFSGATWVKYLGDDGTNGTNGTRGSRINYGTACTGTSTTGTVFATGLSDSLVGDAYINTSTEYLYQCTLGGNASTAKWAYAGSLKGSAAEAALEGVQLNGVSLTPTAKVVDVNALPITETDPSAGSQDVALYTGDTSGSLVRGHLYQNVPTYDDNTLTFSWSNTTLTLVKHSGNSFWDDGDGSSYDWSLAYSSTAWVLTGSGPYYTSPAASADSNPWDFSGVEWSGPMSGLEITPTITRAATYSWADITPSGSGLPLTTTDPASGDDAIAMYTGASTDSLTKGHVYEKAVEDSSISLSYEMNGSTMRYTLTKQSDALWSDSANGASVSYDSTEGAWCLSDSLSQWYSPACESTDGPWTQSGVSWADTGSSYGAITPTIPSPVVVSDISPMTDMQLNGIDVTPSDHKVNIEALAIATSMPTAADGCQPFLLFLGTTGGGFTKGHLYELTETIAEGSSMTMTIDGSDTVLTYSGSNNWSSDSMVSVYYNSSFNYWVLERGFTYISPTCDATVMPWDLNGETWSYEAGGVSLTPTFTDPRTFSWTDLGAMLGS